MNSQTANLLARFYGEQQGAKTLYQRGCLWLADRFTGVANWFLGQAYPAWRGK